MPKSRTRTLKNAVQLCENERAYLFTLFDIVAQVANEKITSHSKSRSREIGEFSHKWQSCVFVTLPGKTWQLKPNQVNWP